MSRWWIVMELSFWRSSYKEEILLRWIKCRSLSWSLFILLFSVRLWKIQIKRQYANWEEKMAFITVLNLSLVILFEIWIKACKLLLILLQSLKICSWKVSLLSIKIANNYLEETTFYIGVVNFNRILVKVSSKVCKS